MSHTSAVWTPGEKARLAELCVQYRRKEIGLVMTAEFGVTRTSSSVGRMAGKLGLRMGALADPWWAGERLEDFFGSRLEAFRSWMINHPILQMKFLPPSRGASSRFGEWRVRESHIAEFIRAEPWAYNPNCLWPFDHPLARLAKLSTTRDPWVTTTEAEMVTGLARRLISDWARRGKLGEVRHRRLGLSGARAVEGQKVVRASAVLAYVRNREGA